MNDTDKEKIYLCFGILLNSIPHLGQFYGQQAIDAIYKTLFDDDTKDRIPNKPVDQAADKSYQVEVICKHCKKMAG